MQYIPHTPEDIEEMLKVIGCDSIDSLFADIPEQVRLSGKYKIPKGLSEPELYQWMRKLAGDNEDLEQNICFMGAGAYEHFIPVLVDNLSGRSEFWTSYTPYQPEASQGNLQAIFEFQTMICELTAMDIANASVYDGPTALAEAIMLAYFHHRKKRKTILLAPTLPPEYLQVAKTYMQNLDVELKILPESEGSIDLRATSTFDENVVAVVVASPNFYGIIEDVPAIAEMAHRAGALMISVVNPISLGVLIPPGDYGADIAVGDGQSLGISPGYGGPSFGFFAAQQKYLRKMPGRITGQTVDKDGKRGFVLTLQTREQHIRREKATSNICTNQALMALRGLIYLACMGKNGFSELASQCLQKAHYLASAIDKIPGFSLCYRKPFFQEFAVHCPKLAEDVLAKLREHGIFGGIPLSRWFPDRDRDLLIAVTECRSKKQLDDLVEILSRMSPESEGVL